LEHPPVGAWVLAGTPLGVVLLEIICMLLLAGSPVGGAPPELPAAVPCAFFVILFPLRRSDITCDECWSKGEMAALRVKQLCVICNMTEAAVADDPEGLETTSKERSEVSGKIDVTSDQEGCWTHLVCE